MRHRHRGRRSAAVLRLLPSVRRVMGWAWVVPAPVPGVAAAVRWVVSG
ncbi:hypothetical protein ACIHCV_13855 [Streptomyces sp. NPDC051956]